MSLTFKDHPNSKLFEIVIDGPITEKEFTPVIAALEAKIAKEGGVHLLKEVRNIGLPEFGVIAKNFQFSTRHLKDFKKVALVAEKGWMQSLGRASSGIGRLLGMETQVFSDHAQAVAWLNGSGNAPKKNAQAKPAA